MQPGHGRPIFAVRTERTLTFHDPTAKIKHIFGIDKFDPELFRKIPTYVYLFDEQDPGKIPTDVAMTALAQSMISPNADDAPDGPIPAGYTYLGQFIFHDMSHFVSKSQSLASAALDLDSVLGRGGHVAEPAAAGATEGPLAIGLTHGDLAADIPRVPYVEADEPDDEPAVVDETLVAGFPRIPDVRNDAFLALSQLHLLLIKFYNAVAGWYGQSGKDVPAQQVRRCVVQHFQSVVISDYLPRIIRSDVYDSVMGQGRLVVHPGPFTKADPFHVALEVAAAAGRFGHSMVRTHYDWNGIHRDGYFETLLEFSHRNSWPSPYPYGMKLTRIDLDWVIEWGKFFDLQPPFDGIATNLAKAIDTWLEPPLATLPEHFRDSSADRGPTFSVAETTLARQREFGLSGAQAAIARMNLSLGVQAIVPLTGPQLAGSAPQVFQDFPELLTNTPIWYYVLREAEVAGVNGSLGPMGSRLVMETIHAAIEASEFSIFREKGWQPSLPRANPAYFTMPDLILFTSNAATTP